MRLMRITLALVLCLSSALTVASELKLATWNIERLGAGQKSFVALAEVLAEVDFVAVQEVMAEEAVDVLREAVQKRTGQNWASMVSHRIGRGTHKEAYAFLWRTEAVDYVDGAVVFLDRGDRFAREPFSARFYSRLTGTPFVAAQIHVIYGKGQEERVAEVQELAEYWRWLEEVYPETPTIMLMGDFNLPPTNPAWKPMRQVAVPLVTRGASTLSSINGRYANLYDNIWISRGAAVQVASARVLRYPELIGWTHEQARRFASDHAPIVVQLRAGSLAEQLHEAPEEAQKPQASAVGAVRGNRNSHLYHLSHCPSFDGIASRNRVDFRSEDEAVAAGYRKARNCK